MPKRTRLKECIKCGNAARIGVYLGYYALRGTPKQAARLTPSRRRPLQVKGTLPARGYCLDCFVRLVKSRGWSRGEVLELQEKIEGERRLR